MSPEERESAHQRVVSACESARMLVAPLNAEARMREKQASREQDAADLASGKISQEELRQKNGKFAFPNAKLLLDKARLA
jgi:hypothetical protein